MNEYRVALFYGSRCVYIVSKKKGATGFFAVTFTNIDGFS